jgi:serine/threonine-protein kinase
VPEADLRVYRAALAKAVNHLSWKPDVVAPRAADRDATVLAVDVRKLDWDKDDLWREVLRAYPYGLRYGTSSDPVLQRLDEDVARLAGCELPYVRADWFVATAARPPLYHTLLRLPKDARELERLLDVDVEANFGRDELARAGFNRSGVSGQNRMVERHAARHGAYWKSYDFKEDNRLGNLFRLPLGPAFAGNPFGDQAFRQDGGEILFSLPNGLQGYLLVNAKDERIDAGPTEVVSDSLRTSGTTAVVTGISCMACHKHGMIAFKDQVRDGTAVAGDARRKVQRLYPPVKGMDEKVKEDAERFLQALEKAAGPFLRVGADKDKPLKDFAEPIGEVARPYRLIDLDLTAAACELDVARPADLRALIGANKRQRELCLAPLLQEGGAVKRADWERVGATSLMQRAAREMDRGTPFNVTR